MNKLKAGLLTLSLLQGFSFTASATPSPMVNGVVGLAKSGLSKIIKAAADRGITQRLNAKVCVFAGLGSVALVAGVGFVRAYLKESRSIIGRMKRELSNCPKLRSLNGQMGLGQKQTLCITLVVFFQKHPVLLPKI